MIRCGRALGLAFGVAAAVAPCAGALAQQPAPTSTSQLPVQVTVSSTTPASIVLSLDPATREALKANESLAPLYTSMLSVASAVIAIYATTRQAGKAREHLSKENDKQQFLQSCLWKLESFDKAIEREQQDRVLLLQALAASSQLRGALGTVQSVAQASQADDDGGWLPWNPISDLALTIPAHVSNYGPTTELSGTLLRLATELALYARKFEKDANLDRAGLKDMSDRRVLPQVVLALQQLDVVEAAVRKAHERVEHQLEDLQSQREELFKRVHASDR